MTRSLPVLIPDLLIQFASNSLRSAQTGAGSSMAWKRSSVRPRSSPLAENATGFKPGAFFDG